MSRHINGTDGVHWEKDIAVAVSSISVQLCQQNLNMASSLAAFVALKLNNGESETPKPKLYELPPRIELLSDEILTSLDFWVVRLEVAVLSPSKDGGNNMVSLSEKEIVMEECIGDYLLVVSCFNFDQNSQESVQVAFKICTDRLLQLGFSSQAAFDCADVARAQLMSDIELVRRTQSQTVYEFSSRNLDLPSMDSVERMCENSDGHIVIDADEASVLTNGDSIMEGNSQESIDFVETALRNAVERTISSFLPRLEGN